ncbi:hypothetical protein F4779DRAFT_430153 [Xylariaceae sp. FL0662B]|nr:hypothetical protein F4779DRAFT_430153 [Xylariaceae sp. FL0662B]
MAYLQDVVGKRRSRYRHHHTRSSPSPSRHHDWEPPPHHTTSYSLPYRARASEIQRPDDRKPTRSSHRRPRLSEDLDVRDPMPPPQPLLSRSATVTRRKGKSRAIYVDEDDDDDELSRSRSRSRSRSWSRTRPRPRLKLKPKPVPISSSTSSSDSESDSDSTSSSSGHSDTYVISTPPRSAHLPRSATVSRQTSRPSSRTPSTDSASSTSTRDERKERRARKGKGVAIPVVERTDHRRHRQKHRKNPVYEEDSDLEPIHKEPVYVEEIKSAPQRRRRRHSDSPSSSQKPRHHRHRDHYIEVKPSSSSKRPYKRYYESAAVYPERPPLSRSHTTSSSHVTSSRSVSSSSRRSSMLLNKFMGPTFHISTPEKTSTVECVVCYDELSPTKTAKLRCGHRMCRSCLKKSFRKSISDPSQMPPRCCTSDCIPLKHVENLFSTDFKKTWNRKFQEFSTRNRIYCPGKRCGEWIKPSQIQRHSNGRKVGKCSNCHTRVCCDCNNKWHGSSHCPTDEETDEILRQAKEKGWQRCYDCRNMIELKEGCNHMTCRCGAEFCMICGLAWKTCECPWFSYDTAEQDELDHMRTSKPTMDHDPFNDPSPRGFGSRPRPRSYEEDLLMRRFQEQRDEEYARRLQYDDDDDGNYLGGGMGDVTGIGKSAGHFMSDDYRRRPQNVTVPLPPAPVSPSVVPFERSNSVADYVSGVNRARGVRGTSMERRLADRFSEQRQNSSPHHRPFTHPIPPPPALPRAVGLPPPPPPPPPMMPISMHRRHTMDDDVYDSPRSSRHSERVTPRRATTTNRDYIEVITPQEPAGRVRRRRRESSSPKGSVLAGLAGPGSGMHRVFEWVNHVEPGDPGPATVVT